jgi:ABC-type dipeptide/oligopeptide/nickel transport system permease subunit
MSLATLARNTGYAFGENRLTLTAAIILALLALCAIFGPSIAPFDPLTTSAATKLAPPSALHPFGTDALGRDILSRVIVAARLDLGMAISAVVRRRLGAGVARGLFRRLDRPDYRPRDGHHHGLPAVRARDGDRGGAGK